MNTIKLGVVNIPVEELELPVGSSIVDSKIYPGNGSYLVNDGLNYVFVTVNNNNVNYCFISPSTIKETFKNNKK